MFRRFLLLVSIYSIIISFCIGGIIFECKNDKYINEEIRNFGKDKKQEIKHIKEFNENQQKQHLAYFVFLIIQYFLIVYYAVFAIPHFFN